LGAAMARSVICQSTDLSNGIWVEGILSITVLESKGPTEKLILPKGARDSSPSNTVFTVLYVQFCLLNLQYGTRYQLFDHRSFFSVLFIRPILNANDEIVNRQNKLLALNAQVEDYLSYRLLPWPNPKREVGILLLQTREQDAAWYGMQWITPFIPYKKPKNRVNTRSIGLHCCRTTPEKNGMP
jgi:hypothetical protein